MILAIVQINPTVGALKENTDLILRSISSARERGATMILFSELSICGYPPEDLLLLTDFIEETEKQLQRVIAASKGLAIFVGWVRRNLGKGKKKLFNSCAIIEDGKLLGIQDKALLPDYDVFFERRYFEPSLENKVWSVKGLKVAVTICEDLWQDEQSSYPYDPISALKNEKVDLLLNLSASPYHEGQMRARERIAKRANSILHCPLAYCNQVGGNDRLIFDGHSFFLDKKGNITQLANGFEEDLLLVDLQKSLPPLTIESNRVEELFKALTLGVRDYFFKQGFTKAILGVSGGIDSAVVAAIAVAALGAKNVLGLFMPSGFTSNESREDSYELAHLLGIDFKEISIEQSFTQMLSLLKPYFQGKAADTTEENLQARIRGMILMAFSNKFGHIVLGTGNKSEMAMGYATLYGDMCGGIGVISDLPKKDVYALAHYINRERNVIPERILTKPPSAELLENQKDSDSLPPYDIIDVVLEDYVESHLNVGQIAEKRGFSKELVSELIRKIHANEYKRRQAPPGLRVTKRAFTVGRFFPIVQKWVSCASQEEE